jgi:hypothetical protein
LIRPTDPIVDRIRPYRRVVLTLLPQDRDSIAAIQALYVALSAPGWRRVATGADVEVYERTGTEK